MMNSDILRMVTLDMKTTPELEVKTCTYTVQKEKGIYHGQHRLSSYIVKQIGSHGLSIKMTENDFKKQPADCFNGQFISQPFKFMFFGIVN